MTVQTGFTGREMPLRILSVSPTSGTNQAMLDCAWYLECQDCQAMHYRFALVLSRN